MKKYDIYGMGNALVDLEYEVDDQFLLTQNIEKGLMTLVDQERQLELTSSLGNMEKKRACGGSAANTIIGFTQLGGRSYYSCKVASDSLGDFYYSDLKSNGVALSNKAREAGITGQSLVMVTSDAQRTMNTFLGITESYSHDQFNQEALEASRWLYIEGYLVTGPGSLDAAIKARDHALDKNIKVAMTFSDPAMVKFCKDGLDSMLGKKKIDLLFCNSEEAQGFTGCSSVDEAMEVLKERAHSLAITLGPDGALLWHEGQLVKVSAPKANAIDTNGAGDLFAGAYLYGLHSGMTSKEAGELATKSSARLVEKFGARLTAEEVALLKK